VTSNAAGLRRGLDAHTSHHWSAQAAKRCRPRLGSVQVPLSLAASSLMSQRRASSLRAKLRLWSLPSGPQ
jgi:hypothetical protein